MKFLVSPFQFFNFKRLLLVSLLLFLVFGFKSLTNFYPLPAQAQDCGTDLQCQIDQIQREFDALSPAHEKNKEELAKLKKQLSDLNKKIASISNQLKTLQAEIAQREEDLAYAQRILDEKALSQYIDSRLYDPVLFILSAPDASEAFKRINRTGSYSLESMYWLRAFSSKILWA